MIMRFILTGIFTLFFASLFSQGLISPDKFLGYDLGEHFTPQHKVADYFDHVSRNSNGEMQLLHYGKTFEGNDLLIAIVSSQNNINRLEDIRKNNLRLAGLLNDKKGDVNMPSIVWLSYNVHGNEASSTEVSMKLLYDLLSGLHSNYKKWLENTVVIIDPCLNPDGRNRYVNWYNQTAGKNPNADPLSREHSEPWPGGRVNHYYFDLNRDWAWQTQEETRQRIKIYNNWMPQIHCDFHEQYPNDPYYFAPAAEPFHEVITPWQREFQNIIGKNHAKYFDANGWLYFTKEVFDLFYPSYGDTYPLYNGSIGMTYEQAGHSRGGLAIQVNDDTLTLKDRILHHYTTSISTIETASENYVKLNRSFEGYFNNYITNGAGVYKSFLLTESNENKLNSLLDLLQKNKIEYTYAKQGAIVKGYNYFSNAEESYHTTEKDVIVSTFQPKGALVKVLFEPLSKLSDSLTYDITAWSMPYVYGINCFGIKDDIKGMANKIPVDYPAIDPNRYAYVIRYESFEDGKLLAALLKNNFKVRFAEKDFSYAGKKYAKGSMVILRNENANKINWFLNVASIHHADVHAVSSGFMDSGFDFGSEKLHLIKQPKVALLTGDNSSPNACGEIWHLFEQQLDYPVSLINSSEIINDNLKNIDVIIVPDGEYKFLSEKESNLKSWVRQGGKLIVLEGALSQLSSGDWGIKLKSDAENSDTKPASYSDIKRYDERERKNIANNIPGAIYKVSIDESHPLAFGYPDFYFSLKLNGNMIEFVKDGWNVGTIKQQNQIAGFVGNEIKSKIKDGTVIAVKEMGIGSVVCFTDDPIFRSFWENGKLLFTNAVFLVGQ